MANASAYQSASFGSRTDIGRMRDHNEDSLSVSPPLYVVCDGMGGHAAGEVASDIAVNVITRRAPRTPDAAALGQAVEEANLAIIQAAREGHGREGMGTTCTAAILQNERLVIAQVGDSRAYLVHNGALQQITRDHSLMADYIEAGRITPEEARVHPERSIITRALGSDPYMQPDLFEINVETGDRLLLCSDGLSSMLEDAEIGRLLSAVENPQECAHALANAACEAGGMDNVTVIVVDVTGFAEKRRRKIARKTKVTAIVIIAMLALILGAAVAAFAYWTTHSAYLADQGGSVAIYEGVPGNLGGMTFSSLVEVTDVPVDELQSSVANRLRDQGIRLDSVEQAKELVESYRRQIAERGEVPGAEGNDPAGSSAQAAASADSRSSAASAASSEGATGSSANRSGGEGGRP